MAQTGDLRMVVAPAAHFREIAAAMAGLGLAPGPDDAVTPPAIPGEREFAYWTSPEGEGLVHYSFNPVVYLRVLAFSGAAALRLRAAASERLPALEVADIRPLLRSQDVREVLLGLFAAAELKAAALIGDVEALRIHPDRHISQAAGQAAETLAHALLSAGAERLAAAQRRHPDRSAVFPRLGNADMRREILVGLLAAGDGASEEVAGVLRAALADADWRVRAAAMLVAARLGAVAVWQDIRQMDLPGTGRGGLDRRRRSILRAARKAALAELAAEPLPPDQGDESRLARRLRDHLAGRRVDRSDEIGDWIESWLENPVDEPDPRPAMRPS
jgi:hypothetical protein